MTTTHDTSSMYSAFMSIPTELRCQIYDYLLSEAHSITVSAGYTTVFGQRIKDHARKQNVPGLPLDLAPLARRHYDASLLSIAKPPEIAIDNNAMGAIEQEGGNVGMPAPMALQLSCRHVNDELRDCMRRRRATKLAPAGIANPHADQDALQVEEDDGEGLSLYVTYPYGILVLKSMYPYLLKNAKRVYISGYHTSATEPERGSSSSSSSASASPISASDASDDERLTPANSFEVAPSFSSARATRSFTRHANKSIVRTAAPTAPTRPRLRLDPPLPQRTRTDPTFPAFSAATRILAPLTLDLLVRTIMPPEPTLLAKLTTRIVYQGADSYSSVWNDDASPVSHTLRNICGGKIDMKVKRGSLGTGMSIIATPRPDGRVISTSWENWRGDTLRRGRNGMEVGFLDRFLVGEGEGAGA